MKSKTVFALALTALLCVVTFAALHVPPAKAARPEWTRPPADQPCVTYSPPTLNAAVGGYCTVTVRAYSPVNLDIFAWQMIMTWDPNVLQNPSIMSGNTLPDYMHLGYIVDNINGQLTYGGCCLYNGQSWSVPTMKPLTSFMFAVTFYAPNGASSTAIGLSAKFFGLSDDGNGWTTGNTDPWGNGWPEYTTYPVWVDLYKDNVIDIFDGVQFSHQWGKPYNSAYDFDADGIVDTFDYAILTADYGMTSASPHWLQTNTLYGITTQVSSTASFPGDINGDGIVDLYDAIILSMYFGQPKT